MLLCCATSVRADDITIGGTISQSTQDGTGPAVNNPGLNSILDGDSHTTSLHFTGAITTPGTYDLTGSSLVFSDPSARATENSFNSISLTITQSGGVDEFSILACLTTGSSCAVGNQLDLNFTISSSQLNSPHAAAESVPLLLPLDLLEDDGATDIHGSVATYSYEPSFVTRVPEPVPFMLLCCGLFAVAFMRLRSKNALLH